MATVDMHPEPSLVHVIKELRDDTVRLIRQEVALAKREMVGKFTMIGKNTAFLGVGALVGLYFLFFFFLFLNNLIQAGLSASGFSGAVSAWFAPLILSLLLGVAALSFMLKSLRSMRKEKFVPQKTLDTLKDDKDWVRAKLKKEERHG